MTSVVIESPIHSYDSAVMQMNAGAGELYVGMLPGVEDRAGFSARSLIATNGAKTHVTEEELQRICAEAHKRKVRVQLTANVPMLGSDPDGSNTTKMQYVEFVKRGVACGVDAIIVGDWGNLAALRKAGITTEITASVHLAAMNRFHLHFLEDLGVTSAVIPQHMHLHEIETLVNCSKLRIIVFAHFGCSFIEPTCGLLHEMGEQVSRGIPCRAKWYSPADGSTTPITNVAEDCSICSLDKFIKYGVYGVKIVGRATDPKVIAAVTRTYAVARDLYIKGFKKEEVLKALTHDMPWWKQAFCETKACKYTFTSHYL